MLLLHCLEISLVGRVGVHCRPLLAGGDCLVCALLFFFYHGMDVLHAKEAVCGMWCGDDVDVEQHMLKSERGDRKVFHYTLGQECVTTGLSCRGFCVASVRSLLIAPCLSRALRP